jgi:hypothetical protein
METSFKSQEWTVQVKKALATLAIEKAISEKFGNPLLDTVKKRLYEKYHCYLPDCYKNPEFLHRVLEDLFGGSYLELIRSVWDELGYCILVLPKFDAQELR